MACLALAVRLSPIRITPRLRVWIQHQVMARTSQRRRWMYFKVIRMTIIKCLVTQSFFNPSTLSHIAVFYSSCYGSRSCCCSRSRSTSRLWAVNVDQPLSEMWVYVSASAVQLRQQTTQCIPQNDSIKLYECQLSVSTFLFGLRPSTFIAF